MAESRHRVGIEIAADEDLGAVTKAKSALDDFSKGGIQAVEKLEDKVIGLQRSTINLRKEVEANRKAQAELSAAEKAGTVTKQQAAQMTSQLTTREKELTTAMQRASFAQKTAQADLRNLNMAQREAAENAQMLAAQFGVNLPPQLTKLTTRLPGLQSALGAAFNVGLIGAFVTATVGGIATVIETYQEFANIAERIERERMARINEMSLGVLGKAGDAIRQRQLSGLSGMAKSRQEFKFVLQDTLEQFGAKSVADLPEDVRRALQQIQHSANTQGSAAETKARQEAAAAAWKRQAGIEMSGAAQDQRQAEAQINAAIAGMEADDALRKTIDEVAKLGPTWESVHQEMEKGGDQMRRSLEMTWELADAERKVAEERRREVEAFGNDIEAMYNRITSNVKSAADVFKNIRGEYLNWVKHQFFQGLAGMLSGGSPGAATAGAGAGNAGILGGVLGGIIGMPGAAAAGGIAATPPFVNHALPPGAVPAQTVNVAGIAGYPPTTPLGTLLGKLHGVGPISGGGLMMGGALLGGLTVGNSNRALSALGGLASGAMMGTALMPGIGTAVGAAIGGLVGLFSGGGGGQKRADAEIADQGFAQLRQILEDYQRFRRDYASSIDAAERVWQQMSSQWQRRESAISQRPYYDAIIADMGRTEDERNRRREWMSLKPLPEFAAGGYTGAGGPAMLHPGEFVMTRQAVDRIGMSVLQGLNTAGGSSTAASGDVVTVQIARVDFTEAVERAIPVILRKGGAASRVLRG